MTQWGRPGATTEGAGESNPSNLCEAEGHEFAQVYGASADSEKPVPVIYGIPGQNENTMYTQVYCTRCTLSVRIVAVDQTIGS